MSKVVFTRVETDSILTYLRGLANENRHIPHTIEQLCAAITGFTNKKMGDQSLRGILRDFKLTCIAKRRPRGTGIWAKTAALEDRFEHLLGWAKSAGYVPPGMDEDSK